MDRTRASSLESHQTPCDKYDSFSSNLNPNNIGRRNRLHSLVSNPYEFSDESGSMDYYYSRHCNRPDIINSDLKSQFDILQCTVNRMLNGDVFDEMGSGVSSVNLSQALKYEYHQMMNALKELETILGCKPKLKDASFSQTPCKNDNNISHMQREIYFRDSLIKCLSDRLKVLCKANDKLIIDYENQENILSEELICLKHQLEKAKDALRALSVIKSHSNISSIQDIEKETYYLTESLRTKDMLISDLKRRLELVNSDYNELKCELENKEITNSRISANHMDRELSYTNHLNEQLQIENDSLKSKLECKNQLINDLQNKLDLTVMGLQGHGVIEALRNKLCLANEENEMTKEAILDQSDMLEDLKMQIKMLSENNQFKDKTISELRCCLRKLSGITPDSVPIRDTSQIKQTAEKGSQLMDLKCNNLDDLLNFIKQHINQHQPDLMRLLKNNLDSYDVLEAFFLDLMKMTNQTNGNHNTIENFKEFLTNEINLKSSIIKFLTTNLNNDIESLDKLQMQMNSILSIDMDTGFQNDLKNYLHQCFLLDDNMRLVIEYLVASISPKSKNLASEDMSFERNSLYSPDKLRDKLSLDTNSRMTNVTTNTNETKDAERNNHLKMIHELEEELRIQNKSFQDNKQHFNSELEAKNKKIDSLNKNILELENLLDEKLNDERNLKKLIAEHEETLDKSREYQLDNDKLRGEIEILVMKNQQLERTLKMKNSELDNLEKSMRRVSTQVLNLSSTHENVNESIKAIKDAEIEALNKEIENLKADLIDFNQMKMINNEQNMKISKLSQSNEALEGQNREMKKQLTGFKNDIDKCNIEKNNLFESLQQMQEAKDEEIQDLISKVSQQSRFSLRVKSIQTDPNDDFVDEMNKLKKEKLELSQQLKQDGLESSHLKSSLNNLSVESRAMEIKLNSLRSDKNNLENQVKQLRDKINEICRNCEENHIDKQLLKSENEQSELCMQRISDLENILACLTDELNEKVLMVENLRKLIKSESQLDERTDSITDKNDEIDMYKQLLLQKDSEIAYLKSKLCCLECEKASLEKQPKRELIERFSQNTSDITNLLSKNSELEKRIDQLNQQLTERSENIAQLQKLLNEKDEIIENSYKIIKTKSQSLMETEKMMHLMSLENTNIKEELTEKMQSESQVQLLQLTIRNLTQEIMKLQSENDKCRAELNRINSEKLFHFVPKSKSINSEMNTQSQISHLQPTILPDNSVQQINNEIQKLYIDFEGKSNEIKEYSLKEIKNRDKKIDELNIELKLKADQFQTIMIENRRLQNKIEDESQRSTKYEQTLLLKEQLLEKLLKEKEKIRATFITELHSKGEELDEKNKTVYFLNAELHRLASQIEILGSELQVVKVNEKFQVQSKNTLEISEKNLEVLKAENNSLKLCINLHMAELDAVKNELTIKQTSNQRLLDQVQHLTFKTSEQKSGYEMAQRDSFEIEKELKGSIKSLTRQLKEIQEKYQDLMDTKATMESVLKNLEKENFTIKQAKENLENEKDDYRTEINHLRSKIDSLTNNLVECKEKTALSYEKPLNQSSKQIEKLTEENSKYRIELETMSKQMYDLERKYELVTNKFDQSIDDLNDKEKEIQKLKDTELKLNSGLKHSSNDCHKLKSDYEAILKQFSDFKQKCEQYENQEKTTHRMMDQKDSQYCNLQDNLDQAKSQLFLTEDKLKLCNNQWLDKYGQLKENYDRMEYDFVQAQNQIDILNQDIKTLEISCNSQNTKLEHLTANCRKLNDEKAELVRENCIKSSDLDRLCCDNNALQNCNADLTSQIESINRELMTAHTDICDLSVQLHNSQTQINELTKKFKENTSLRHYGSHPVLNQADLDQKDYCDLRNRYSALCGQVDNLVCQLKKKDKRLMDLQREYDILSNNLSNCEQIQCDYQELNYRYIQLKDDFDNLSNYYQNINFSHNEQNLQMQDHGVSVIRICADELQETINCQNQEIDNLKCAHQVLENDYQICCERVNMLEKQIELDNLELEKYNHNYCDKYNQLKYAYDDTRNQIEQINDLKQELADKTTRIVEITNINENIEQQIAQAHQQISCQNQIIEQCQHELAMLKNAEKSNEMKESVNCLNKKIHDLEYELHELQNQYHDNYTLLRQEQDNKLEMTEKLRESHQRIENMKNLSSQLSNKDDIIEQLTEKNHQLCSEINENQQKINQILEQNNNLHMLLNEKNEQLIMLQRNLEDAEDNCHLKEREFADLSNHVDYLTEQIEQRNILIQEEKKKLEISYQTIEDMRKDQNKVCNELNELIRLNSEKDHYISNKNELLAQYGKELELNYELIQKLQLEKIPSKSYISKQEFCEITSLNEKLSDELDYLHQRIRVNSKHIGSQTQYETEIKGNDPMGFYTNTPSPVSEYGILNELDPWVKKSRDKSHNSDLTYSSSKSVAWKTTHTDPEDNGASGVHELQKAIDEYNTLVTSIELSETGFNPPFDYQRSLRNVRRSQIYEDNLLEAAISNQKIDVDLPNADEGNFIVIDVDSMLLQPNSIHYNTSEDSQHFVSANISPDVISENASANIVSENISRNFPQMNAIVGVNQTLLKDVIELLKNNEIQIEYDEMSEPFESYFYRLMKKYNELEQFYLTSMKINIDYSLDHPNAEYTEIFPEKYENAREQLIQHCKILKSTIPREHSESHEHIQFLNDVKISTEEIVKLVDVITSQQLQLSALQLTHRNLQKITEIEDAKPVKISPHQMNQEYLRIWQNTDVCNPNIKQKAQMVRQLSLEKRKLEPASKDDRFATTVSVKTPIDNIKSRQRVYSTTSLDRVVTRGSTFNSGRISGLNFPQESVQMNTFRDRADSALQSREKENKKLLSKRVSRTSIDNLIRNDSKSIKFGRSSDLNYFPETINLQNSRELEIQLNPSTITSVNSKGLGPNFQQQFSEGVSLSEGKAHAIKNMEDTISFAHVGQFEKEIHQLNNIDFENIDNSIPLKDRIRIYATEIDYLNEKNLFHNYAINGITNPGQYQHNPKFVNQLSDSLTSKAKSIVMLQKEFQFDPHLSKKEKDLINDVLDPKKDLTYRKLFEIWMEKARTNQEPDFSAELTNKIHELTKKLEYCQSQINLAENPKNDQIITKLINEKKALNDKLNEYEQIISKDKLNPLNTSRDSKVLGSLLPDKRSRDSYISVNKKNEEKMNMMQKSKSDENLRVAPPSNAKNAYSPNINTLNKGPNKPHIINKLDIYPFQPQNVSKSDKPLEKSQYDKMIETLISEKNDLNEKLSEYTQNINRLSKENSAMKMKQSTNSYDDVNAQLEECKATVNRLTKENDNLKQKLKAGPEKGQPGPQQFNNDKQKQSKIPLLKGSSFENQQPMNIDRQIPMKWDAASKRILADMTNISKSINSTTDNLAPFRNSNNNTDELVKASNDIIKSTEKMTQAIGDIKSTGQNQTTPKKSQPNDKSLLQSAGKLVSPQDVKAAIAAEDSIESLKNFASLLAEDNFDLAAEIEKLLATIEELRRQLKENCDVLSETVNMLENSENFVNQLEKKLNVETKKTQVITTRIDKLNDLNEKVIVEMERILKQRPTQSASDMNSQERYDYLFACLKKIEAENINLQKKNEELERKGGSNFFGLNIPEPIDFEFETSLMPNGMIRGTINMLNSDNIPQTLALNFDVNLYKDDNQALQPSYSNTIAHFLIEQEAHFSEMKNSSVNSSQKQKKDDNTNSNNNNSCCSNLSLPLSASLVDDMYSLNYANISSRCSSANVRNYRICERNGNDSRVAVTMLKSCLLPSSGLGNSSDTLMFSSAESIIRPGCDEFCRTSSSVSSDDSNFTHLYKSRTGLFNGYKCRSMSGVSSRFAKTSLNFEIHRPG